MKRIFLTVNLLLGLVFAPAQAATYAITHAVIHPLDGQGVITQGTLVMRDGKIAALGKDVAVPADADVIDAKGRVVTPGFMDAMGYMGLVEVGAVDDTVDAADNNDHFTAAFDVAPAINPRSTLIPINRIEGITRAVSAPWVGDGETVLAGQGAVIQLGSTEGYIVRDPAAMFAVLGAAGSAHAGGSRAAALLQLREALLDARDYAAHKRAYEQNDRRAYALSRLDLEALQPVLAGKLPLVVGVNRASDIEQALKLAQEFKLRLIISGGAEAWMVKDDIARAKVPVILDPLADLPESFEEVGATLQNAAALNGAGVTVAFSSGESHNARNLKQGAGNSVAYGLPYEDALRALTVNPARMFGVEDAYGTLAPGMDADVVLWSGDPLEVTTFADQVFIRGKKIPMESRQTKLRDRYLKLHQDWPPAYNKP